MSSISANQLDRQEILDTSAYDSKVEEVVVQEIAEAGTFCIMFDLSSKGCIEPEALVIDDLIPKPPEEADDEEARQTLVRAREQARMRELRLRVPAVGFGTTFLILSTVLFASRNTTSYRNVLQGLMQHLGLYVLMLGLLPSDRRVVPLLATWLGIPLHIAFLVVSANNARKYLQAVRNDDCAVDGEDYPCWFIMGLGAGMSVRAFTVIVACTRIVCALKARMPSPKLLLVVLSSQCQVYIARGVVHLLWAAAAIPAEKGSVAIVFLVLAFGDMALGYFLGFALDFRSRLQSWFMSRSESTITAAGIAQLLGAQSIDVLLVAARSTFRCVRADLVDYKDMEDNRPNPSLAVLTKNARIGFVDAFVSHSWHDESRMKWMAMQRLRDEFKGRESREPNLWIDKYSVDQNDIESSLACLPIYLAGCKEFWVLCGPTYLERLWCIIEVYVFLQMGGSRENLRVELLDNSKQMFNAGKQFDPRKARCFTEVDTERLHSVIETTGYEEVRQLIKDIFWRRPNRVSTLSLASAKTFDQETYADRNVRQSLFEQVRSLGGRHGAQMLHSELPASYWGVTREQFLSFIEEVRVGVSSGTLKNFIPSNLPPYPQTSFQVMGPNMYQVTQQLIKPCTDESGSPLPFASYALQKNSSAGCICDVFISHAWSEGAFQFGSSVASAWCDVWEGAYICFLANPQNLDIAQLVQSPTSSPFYAVLRSHPQAMIMVGNPNLPIHSRLWCVFEAHCARTFQIPTNISGDPLWLVGENDRSRAQKILLDHTSGLSSGRQLEQAIAELALDVTQAVCFSEEDHKFIWSEIGTHASAVNLMIKEQIVKKFCEGL